MSLFLFYCPGAGKYHNSNDACCRISWMGCHWTQSSKHFARWMLILSLEDVGDCFKSLYKSVHDILVYK